MVDTFHFLHPEALWALVPVTAVLLLLAGRGDAVDRWRAIVAPHLLEHLVVRPPSRWGVRPAHVLGVVMILVVVAVAGPTWQREPSPFAEDTAPLVIALELTPRMLVKDIQPSRLERAKQKIRDLAEARSGSRTALVAYAGSAHLVMPLTDDPEALIAFVMDLEPDLMPRQGTRPEAVLPVAAELLDRDGTPGTVVFVAPGISEGALDAFGEFADGRKDQLQLLVMATEAGGAIPGGGVSNLDRTALEGFERATGAVVTLFTIDGSDVERVQRRAQSHLASVQLEDSEGRWRDEGWWLSWPIAVMVLLWFRRGWTVQWEA